MRLQLPKFICWDCEAMNDGATLNEGDKIVRCFWCDAPNNPIYFPQAVMVDENGVPIEEMED